MGGGQGEGKEKIYDKSIILSPSLCFLPSREGKLKAQVVK